MIGRRITLFRVLGFAVRIDFSWTFIAVLVTWSLGVMFGQEYPAIPAATRWTMALAGMLGLFVSVVLHELSHSLMARRHGMHMRGITLFVFGGVAEMAEEPPNARAEFWMAVVGPIASLLLSGMFLLLSRFAVMASLGAPIAGVTRYLAFINLVLALFNMIPGFPLDGGRILRAVLWGWKRNLRWATRQASRVGSLFGMALMGLGVLAALRGSVLSGVWYLLLGMFLRNAAQNSYSQLLVRRALEGEPVSRFMNPNPVTVEPETRIDRFVDEYVYRHMFKMFPVVDAAGRLWGCITTRHVRQLDREAWSGRRVADLQEPCSQANTVAPQTDALLALALMNRTRTSRLLVVEAGRLVGVVALKDLLGFLSLKTDLESDPASDSRSSPGASS